MTITERPLFGTIIVQTFDLIASPFIIGMSKLDYSPLGQTGEAGIWRDWTPTSTSISIRRGMQRDGINLTNQIGMATVTILDPGDALDPDTGLHPNQVGRILLRRTGQDDVPIFTGTIHNVARNNTRDKFGRTIPVLTLVLADAVREYNNTTRYGATGPETFAQRVARLAASTTEPVEIPTTSPTTLHARTVYESSLANHFTLCANTAGAMWWVGADGITRFGYRAISTAPYAGIITGTQVRTIDGSSLDGWANRLYQTNHLAAPDPDNPGQWIADDVTTEGFTDPVSIGRWGDRADTYDIAEEFDFNDDSSKCLLRMLGPNTTPTQAVQQLTYNAQANFDRVPGFEIGNSITVPREPTGPTGPTFYDDMLIIAVTHTITPTRWLIDLDLIGATNS